MPVISIIQFFLGIWELDNNSHFQALAGDEENSEHAPSMVLSDTDFPWPGVMEIQNTQGYKDLKLMDLHLIWVPGYTVFRPGIVLHGGAADQCGFLVSGNHILHCVPPFLTLKLPI